MTTPTPTETLRRMPAGARKWMLIDDIPFEEFPGPILQWFMRYGLVRESSRRGYTGQLTLTAEGHKIRKQLMQKLEGRS